MRSLRALTSDRADLLAQWPGILLGANTPRGGDWAPVPDLADVLGAPVAQVWHEDATEGHREGWWHLVVHPLPHFRYGQDPYPSMARAFGRAAPEGIGFADRRNIRDEHRIVFGLRCRDAAVRLEALRESIAPLLPPGAATT